MTCSYHNYAIDILYLQMPKKNKFLLVLCNLEDLQVHLLHELGHHFSAAGVSETKITKNSLLDFNPSIASYEFEYILMPLAAVGVKMYIKSYLNYAVIEKSSEDAFQASHCIAVHLYFLRQLKCGKVPINDLLSFTTCKRPVAEYACPVFHTALPQYLSDQLERLQKWALRIISTNDLSYRHA